MPAPVSAGIDRKNDNRVAATRFSPSIRAGESVAPERGNPGKSSARICALPTIIESARVMFGSPRHWVALRSAYHITPLPTINEAATTQRDARGALIRGFAARPTATIGMVA